jgi:cytochrome c oxidase subunit 2
VEAEVTPRRERRWGRPAAPGRAGTAGTSRTASRSCAAGLAIVVVLALVSAGCSSDAPSALDPHGPNAHRVAMSWWLLFGMAAVVYVVVAAFVLRGLGRPVTVPQQRLILFGGVVVPAVILAVVGVETVQATRTVFADTAGDARIVVTGRQYWWDVRYPDDGVVTANEIHIPVGEPVKVDLEAGDVIHSLWVPQLGPKVDMIPGQTNHITLEADEPGTYRGQCAEFCGIEHGLMAFVVVADEPDRFDDWLAQRREAPPEPTDPLARQGEEVFLDQPCAGCHTIAGTEAAGSEGPDLSDVGSRGWIGAGTVRNTPAAMRRWVRDAQDLKPGSLMPPIALSDDDLDALVAYLDQLGAPATEGTGEEGGG